MRNFIPLFVFLAVIVGISVLILVAAQQQQRQHLLERIAERFRGRVERGDWLNFPQVRLRFQNYPALLKFTRVGKHRYHTHFTITWPNPELRCEIQPQTGLAGLKRLLGMEDIEIGSPQFDAAYFISGNGPALVRELLTAEVQAAIFKLAAFAPAVFSVAGTRGVQVKWGGGVMTVTKPHYLSTFEALEDFIARSAELFVAALASRASGIEFVGEAQQPDAAQSQCQICGEALESDLVYCASCHTPHHRDCWEYYGGCSTYACGQKKYARKR